MKRGKRKKKLEEIQRFLCTDCGKTFTPQKVKGKKFPLKVIIDGLSYYSRMREHGKKLFTPNQIIQSTVLYHRQVYKFRYHLEAVSAECPHQFFQEGLRASEVAAKFDLSQVRINEKFNFAVRLAQLVLQAVNNNRERHEILQKFMLANDSVTVAVEVPVWLDNEDLEHMIRV